MGSLVASILFGLIAGTCDASGYLALHKLFTAHVTGNLLILGIGWAAHTEGDVLGRVIAVPIFIIWVCFMCLCADWLQRRRLPVLRIMLSVMVALLLAFMLLGVADGPFRSQDAPNNLLAGMTGVMAMATLNVIARMWRVLAAGTTAMTANTLRMVIDLTELMLGRRPDETNLRSDSARLAATVLAFVAACALTALLHALAGTWCMTLPALFAILMLALWREETGGPQWLSHG
jgi:uncharacterized membrane protein YoaK (UPF0700 family)